LRIVELEDRESELIINSLRHYQKSLATPDNSSANSDYHALNLLISKMTFSGEAGAGNTSDKM
jgi:hypothetical protein